MSPGLSRVLADLVLVVHFLFILFVVAGALLALRWPRIAWVHLPAVLWGILIELFGWRCPLTPLEWRLRHAAGGAVPAEGFVEHYLLPVVYPAGLTREVQLVLAGAVVLVNVTAYAWIVRRRRPRTGATRAGATRSDRRAPVQRGESS